MSNDDLLYFDKVKLGRGDYFVEYSPPLAAKDVSFATLSVNFIKDFPDDYMRKCLQNELYYWLKKYPVPLMIFCNQIEDNVPEGGTFLDDSLVGWIEAVDNTIHFSWSLKDLTDFIENRYVKQDWKKVYTDIPYKTSTEVKVQVDKEWKQRTLGFRVFKYFLFSWVSVIPISWIIFEFFSPIWLALIISLYAACKALKEGLCVLGYAGRTAKELQKADKEREKEHYYYHCVKNPDGFLRLKCENYDREERDRILKEAENLPIEHIKPHAA